MSSTTIGFLFVLVTLLVFVGPPVLCVVTIVWSVRAQRAETRRAEAEAQRRLLEYAGPEIPPAYPGLLALTERDRNFGAARFLQEAEGLYVMACQARARGGLGGFGFLATPVALGELNQAALDASQVRKSQVTAVSLDTASSRISVALWAQTPKGADAFFEMVFLRAGVVDSTATVRLAACPVCGAPLEIDAQGRCAHCGSPLYRAEREWTLEAFHTLPGWPIWDRQLVESLKQSSGVLVLRVVAVLAGLATLLLLAGLGSLLASCQGGGNGSHTSFSCGTHSGG